MILIQNNTHFPTLNELILNPNVSALDGRKGKNRARQEECEISADNDFQAIQIWLNEYKSKVTTHRLYQKEAERLLLWSVFQLQKPLSSLIREDIELYMQFLRNPQPMDIWCAKRGGKNGKRKELNWRPFEGPLSESSISTAVTVINSLFNYLEMARYLRFNPMRLMRNKLKRNNVHIEEQKIKLQERILDMDEWHAMQQTLTNLPEGHPHEKDEKQRLKLIVAMLFLLGLRINELVNHNWSSFRLIQGRWWFVVKGKGDKLGKIPVNDELISIVKEYRRMMLFENELPESDENGPVICSWRTGKAVTPRYINQLLKVLALKTAKHFFESPEKQKKLAKFSAHWLRHLSATMQERAGISESQIMANLRHENIATTKLYIHEDERKRHEQMQLLKLELVN